LAQAAPGVDLAAAAPVPSGSGLPESVSTRKSPQTERVVLLVRSAGDDEVMGRVRAELADSEWAIVELRVDDRLEHSSLGRLARKAGASAAVRLDPTRSVVELWILQPAGDIEETIGTAGERSSSSVLALGATEALRARGLFQRREPEPARAEREERPAPVSKPTLDARPERSALVAPKAKVGRDLPARLWLELAPAAMLSPGGLGPLFEALVGVRVELAGRWSLGALGLLPLTSQDVSGVEGSARVSTFLLAGVAEVTLFRESIADLSAGIGVGATLSAMQGLPEPGYRAEDTNVAAAVGFTRISLGVRLARRWRLSARALLGSSLPQVSIRFEDREVATWGRPFLVASLGLEVPVLDFAH
jgi:hypothetical protein